MAKNIFETTPVGVAVNTLHTGVQSDVVGTGHVSLRHQRTESEPENLHRAYRLKTTQKQQRPIEGKSLDVGCGGHANAIGSIAPALTARRLKASNISFASNRSCADRI